MDGDPAYSRLFRKTLSAMLFCAALVVLCYFFVDRPVAYFVHEHRFAEFSILKWLTYPPPILQAWTPVVLVAIMVRRVFGPFRRWERALMAACVGMVLADQFRETMAYVFGRYWPETWINHNPSLIQDGRYGFHPFHGGSAYGSFPSGHAARMLAVAAIVWIAYPRWQWACVLVAVAVAAGLLGMNYHFAGDVIAGAFVGGIVGAFTAHFCGLREECSPATCPAGPPSGALQSNGST